MPSGIGLPHFAFFTLLFLAAARLADAADPLSSHAENPHRTHRAYASLYVFDIRTGTVLLEDSAEDQRAPASLTKMMTLLLLVEAVERGEAAWADTVLVPWQSGMIGGSGVGLQNHERLSLEDTAKGLIISSGNDAAIAIAEHLAHSEGIWVQRMNRRARALGMRSTWYKTSHGLDGWRTSSVTTAKDQAQLVRELLRHPRILDWTSSRSMVIRGGQTINNTNKLLGSFEGLDGIKTGFTGKAGFCLASTAMRDGFRVGCILLGGPSSADRFNESRWALTEAFLRYRLDVPVRAGETVGGSIPISDGDPATVEAIATEDLPLVRSRADSTAPRVAVIPLSDLRAPLSQGVVVARIEVLEGDRLLTRGEAVSAVSVRKVGWWERFLGRFRKSPS